MRRVALFLSGLLILGTIQPLAADEEGPVDFNRDIRPLLSDNCLKCHGPDAETREADLRLDRTESVFAKRDKPLLVPGRPDESELLRRIMSSSDDEVMPPRSSKKRLTDAQKQLIRRWIAEGAKWEEHWAWIPPKKPVVPPVQRDNFVRSDIDRFVLKRILDAGLTPSAETDAVTLVRRLHFDLIGLPPKPQVVEAYLTSRDPQKYEKLVDSLLASPHFGERMAVYWLDVVRYADTNGYHSDEPRSLGPYRDYVIRSFANNKPFDQFVVEQLAGDLLPEATIEQQVASGFNMLLQTTSEGGAQAKEYLAKYSADRVRNTSQIFLGTTMGCCECHNHKYDPFTAKDFYSFAAFFADLQEIAVGNPRPYPVMTDDARMKLAAADEELVRLRADMQAETPELAAAQTAWETDALKLLQQTPAYGPWQLLGPFGEADFEKAFSRDFGPEANAGGLDLSAAVGEQKWREARELADGKPFDLKGDNSATYLHRVLMADQATEVELLLGSDDALIVWFNGRKVHENKVQRALAVDSDAIKVSLNAGENRLLIKVVNGTGGYQFSFNAKKADLPPAIATILKTAADQRNAGQQKQLKDYFRSIVPALQSVRDQIATVEKRKDEINRSLPTTLMSKTTTPRPIRILPRGNWLDESGPVVEPAIPEFLGRLPVEGRRPTRLDLAQWIIQRDNPLTARTFVNRLWKLYFGQGLARPLDDLGRQGSLPTHPNLLDWLAIEFMDSDWNVKHMIRQLVTSGTYRQSSTPSPDLMKRDPNNQFYARQSRFRLDAELVRDNALAISGLLVPEVGGPSVKPYQPAGYWQHLNFPRREWQNDSGEKLYRRGLYTWWQRMFLHPSLLAFDASTREECTVERPRSNIPQQALVLLNDPTYVEAARAFALRMLRDGGDAPEQRLNWAFREALSRDITEAEATVLRTVLDSHRQQFASDPAAAKQFLSVGASPMPSEMDLAETAAWTQVARVILNLHETITRF